MLAINESNLDDTISDTEVYVPGYIISARTVAGQAVVLLSISGKICRTKTELTLCPTLWK